MTLVSDMRFRQIHLDFHTSGLIPGIGSAFDPAAFGAAYKAARARADAYAEAAGLKIDRVLSIRDGGQAGGEPQPMDAVMTEQMAPSPVSAPPPFSAGVNASIVSVRVDFALTGK